MHVLDFLNRALIKSKSLQIGNPALESSQPTLYCLKPEWWIGNPASESSQFTLHYLRSEWWIGSRLKANLAGLPSDPRVYINPALLSWSLGIQSVLSLQIDWNLNLLSFYSESQVLTPNCEQYRNTTLEVLDIHVASRLGH